MIGQKFRKNKKRLKKIQEFIELDVINSVNKIWIPDGSLLLTEIF